MTTSALQTEAPPKSPDWGAVSQALQSYYPTCPHLLNESVMASANSRAAWSSFSDIGSAAFDRLPEQIASLDEVQAAAASHSRVEAFWWGFHVYLTHPDTVTVLAAADTVNALVVAIGGKIPSPAQPWILALGPFISLTNNGIRALDKGRGVFISMSWFAPGVFVPTTA